jgi:hypothetical protein
VRRQGGAEGAHVAIASRLNGESPSAASANSAWFDSGPRRAAAANCRADGGVARPAASGMQVSALCSLIVVTTVTSMLSKAKSTRRTVNVDLMRQIEPLGRPHPDWHAAIGLGVAVRAHLNVGIPIVSGSACTRSHAVGSGEPALLCDVVRVAPIRVPQLRIQDGQRFAA